MLPIFSVFLYLMAYCATAFGQFNFFEQMFGHPGHQQQQQQARSSGAGQWVAHSESVSCSQYLCPDTLTCVSKPWDCPCPDVQDIKCIVPDTQDKSAATRVCVRGGHECTRVEKLARRLG